MKNFSISQSLSSAWKMLSSNLLLILFFFIATIPSIMSEGVQKAYSIESATTFEQAMEVLSTNLMPLASFGFILTIIEYLLMAGAWNSALTVVKGGKADFNAFNMPASTYIKFACAEFCVTVLICIGLMFCIIPGIFLAVRLGMVTCVIIDDPNCGFAEAFQRSWDMTRGNFWNLFAFGLACMVIYIVGFVCCCVGIYIAIPLTSLATIIIYMALKPEEDVVIEEEAM